MEVDEEKQQQVSS